tara:strand:+ start:948 stop:1532 length:585 start_codon:yes stop_codon:yes gene_type:complete
MSKSLDFYFDFISPYSYLAHAKIQKLELQKKIKINYKPILLGGLHNLFGITAPALIKPKKKFLIQDCEMVAKRFNINFKFNNKFPINSLHLMRGLLTINEDIKEKYINSFFEAYWASNIDLSNKKEINKILATLKINETIFFEKLEEQKIKDLLKNFTQEAYNNEIFGAPTFVVNKKIFWGQDRLDYALDEYKK